MAMLAHKTSMPMSAGLGPSSAAAQAREYPASNSSHRTPLTSTHNGNFASPTESEFSEVYEGPDPVR